MGGQNRVGLEQSGFILDGKSAGNCGDGQRDKFHGRDQALVKLLLLEVVLKQRVELVAVAGCECLLLNYFPQANLNMRRLLADEYKDAVGLGRPGAILQPIGEELVPGLGSHGFDVLHLSRRHPRPRLQGNRLLVGGVQFLDVARGLLHGSIRKQFGIILDGPAHGRGQRRRHVPVHRVINLVQRLLQPPCRTPWP